MPELPEVETLVRGLRATVTGRRILRVTLGKTDFMDNPAEIERDLPGARIAAIERHGKFFLLRLVRDPAAVAGHATAPEPQPAAAEALLVHLGMTGHLAAHAAAEPATPHTHAVFALDDGRELRYSDARRFGRLALLDAAGIAAKLARVGLDPLRVTADELAARLGARRARIKALLLDQHALGGVGNIYADESLWRARLHPARLASSLKPAQWRALHRALQSVLAQAIRLRGSSISDYRDAEGRRGEFQRLHRVYGREGLPCRRCRAKIRRIIVAGRSSHFCPRCQPPPRSK
jgi:formamidopyrimidine-DNA glycosylase